MEHYCNAMVVDEELRIDPFLFLLLLVLLHEVI